MDVVVAGHIKCGEGLLDDELKNRRGEVNFEGALVDSDCTVAFFDDDIRYTTQAVDNLTDGLKKAKEVLDF